MPGKQQNQLNHYYIFNTKDTAYLRSLKLNSKNVELEWCKFFSSMFISFFRLVEEQRINLQLTGKISLKLDFNSSLIAIRMLSLDFSSDMMDFTSYSILLLL